MTFERCKRSYLEAVRVVIERLKTFLDGQGVLLCVMCKKRTKAVTMLLTCEDIRPAPVAQRLDNVIHRINRYPVDKC